MIEVVDAIGRQVRLEQPPERVVSLVPSETVSVADLVGVERLVGRTDYCVEPAGAVESIRSVGGTKGFDVQAVETLRPDLVLANKEENSRSLVHTLIAAGLTVHVSFPCTADGSLGYLESLCALLGVDPDASEPVRACRRAVQRARTVEEVTPLPVFVPIWRDPWMTFDAGTYASDILRLCGARNVFAGRSRLYPLAADLGETSPWGTERVEGRDTRYPRIRLEEIAQRGARAVLLPDEPYAFKEDDAAVFGELDPSRPLVVDFVDGKDLFWYGARMNGAIDRLTDQIARLRSRALGS
jgi:hypothetical protein